MLEPYACLASFKKKKSLKSVKCEIPPWQTYQTERFNKNKNVHIEYRYSEETKRNMLENQNEDHRFVTGSSSYYICKNFIFSSHSMLFLSFVTFPCWYCALKKIKIILVNCLKICMAKKHTPFFLVHFKREIIIM